MTDEIVDEALATLKIILPKPINFFRFEGVEGLVDVGILTDRNAAEIGDQIKRKFIQHAKNRKIMLARDKGQDDGM